MASYIENQRMFLDRHGYLEETFFTFSFSPIRDESGQVGGLFHPVTEQTAKILSERRTHGLRELAARSSRAKAVADVFALATYALAEQALDLPFVLFYAIDEAGACADLVAQAGMEPATIASPRKISLRGRSGPWLFAESLLSGGVSVVENADAILAAVACGPYPEPPKTVVMLPILSPGSEMAAAVLVAGTSARLPMTEAYREFLDMVASTVSAAYANARAYETERQRAEALAELDRAKTAFFSNVSHEFRTPLSLLLGPLADVLADKSMLSGTQRDSLELAHRNALRLLKLVNTLLDFSRIEAGRAHATFQPIDIAKATAELASNFRSACDQAGLSLVIDCPQLPEPVYIDPDMWEKIVLNLISNAFKFTFHVEIRVALCSDAQHVELTVQDSGTGIPATELPRLFDRFHRVEGAPGRTHEGSGIGLALVQELAKLHGGTAAVRSRLGNGSVFTVTIPRGFAHLPSEQLHHTTDFASTGVLTAAFVTEALRCLPDSAGGATSSPQGSSSTDAEGIKGAALDAKALGRPRILLADDNADMRAYIARVLVAAGYDVSSVADGQAALEALREGLAPDLVLSDVMMPRLDGFGLVREIRADPSTVALPVILLSARAGDEAAIEGLGAGSDDYLVKPFAARELVARVRANVQLARIRRSLVIALERANSELDSFSYSVAHDLRSPLAAIFSMSNMLIEDCSAKLGAEGAEMLRAVGASSERMMQLVEALLNLARAGRAELRLESVELSGIVRDAAAQLRQGAPGRQVEFVIEDDIGAVGDPRLLAVVVDNLLGNAWKYSGKRSHTRIEFGAHKTGAETVYFVRDNGAGSTSAGRGTWLAHFSDSIPIASSPGRALALQLSNE